MRILITNDDGMTTPGIVAPYDALTDRADCVVITPDQDKSGANSSLTLDRPLRSQCLDNGFISLNGTPAGYMYLGLNGLLEKLPDVVVSGINLGANLGNDVLYSGTVAAAIEGHFLKGPAFVLSLVLWLTDNLPTVVHFARLLVSAHERLAVPPYIVFDISIPNLSLDRVRGIRLTRLGHRTRVAVPVKVVNPRGKEGYWIATAGDAEGGGPGMGFHVVMQGYVSITPLQLDRTFHETFGGLDEWLGGLT